MSLHADAEGRLPLTGSQSAFLSAEANKRDYANHSNMNAEMIAAKAGWESSLGEVQYRLDLQRRESRQLGAFPASGVSNNYVVNGLGGEARWKLTQGDVVGLVAQYGQIRFQTMSPAQNTNQTVWGANLMHTFQAHGKPLLYAALSRSDDRAVQSMAALNGVGNTNVGRTTDNFLLYGQFSLLDQLDADFMGMFSRRTDAARYARAAMVALGVDNVTTANVGLTWRFAPSWVARAQHTQTESSSNISLYSYRKQETSVTLKREFK